MQHFLLKGKVFERCEFARELVNNQDFARATVGNWVCLANVSKSFVKLHQGRDLGWTIFLNKYIFQFESSYNSGATNHNTNGSIDYGIFQVKKESVIQSFQCDFDVQINDDFWCDANIGYGADCGVSCDRLV